MRHWYLIPLAAIVGLIAGSWGPREDLALTREIKEQQTRKTSAASRTGFGAIANLAGIPDRTGSRRFGRTSRTNTVENAEASTNETAAVEAPATNAAPSRAGRRPLRDDDLRARIDEAAELWRTRCELAKTQWKDKLGVEGEKAVQFDSMVDAMNADLRDLMAEFAGEVAVAKEISPELGVKMMSAVTRTVSEAYDALGECVEAEKRAEVSNLPVYEFVDPAVFEPMIKVQDYLEPSRMGF